MSKKMNLKFMVKRDEGSNSMQQRRYGGVISAWHAADTVSVVETRTCGSISRQSILTSGLIPNVEPEESVKMYLDLVFGIITSDSPNIIPDYLDVETAKYLFENGAEIIGKLLETDFWMVTWQSEGDGFQPVFSAITKDEYMEKRAADCFVIDRTRHPTFYRQCADGYVEPLRAQTVDQHEDCLDEGNPVTKQPPISTRINPQHEDIL